VFWKTRASSCTISAELHDKILRTCTPIEEDFSEIISVRTRAAKATAVGDQQTHAAACTNVGRPVALHFCY